MTTNELIEEKVKGFGEIYGVKHYQVCEGKKCVCRKELKGYIKKALQDIAKAAREEAFEEVIKRIPTEEGIMKKYCITEHVGNNPSGTIITVNGAAIIGPKSIIPWTNLLKECPWLFEEIESTENNWAEEKPKKEPMGISQWKEHGKKYGYWDYFEEGKPEPKEEERDEIPYCTDCFHAHSKEECPHKEKPKEIEELSHSVIDFNDPRSADEATITNHCKINELIDTVNYLLRKSL